MINRNDWEKENFSLEIALPIMNAAYTARHQATPTSNDFLVDHVLGSENQAPCELCREETEFLISHQKDFFDKEGSD